MIDYQFIIGEYTHIQKVLNQWRHDYYLKIEQMVLRPQTKWTDPELVVLVNRERKEQA
jgi:hypothetical protein